MASPSLTEEAVVLGSLDASSMSWEPGQGTDGSAVNIVPVARLWRGGVKGPSGSDGRTGSSNSSPVNTGFWRSSERLRIRSRDGGGGKTLSESTSRAESVAMPLLKSMLDEAALSFSPTIMRGMGTGISGLLVRSEREGLGEWVMVVGRRGAGRERVGLGRKDDSQFFRCTSYCILIG